MTKYAIKEILLSGCLIEFKRLSICSIYNKWQVDADFHNLRESKLYKLDELDEAVEQFLKLYRKVK